MQSWSWIEGRTIDPSRADMRIVLARALRTKGLLDKADAQLMMAKPKPAASGTPQFSQQQSEPDFYMELGLLRRRQGRLQAAADAFQKVLDLESDREGSRAAARRGPPLSLAGQGAEAGCRGPTRDHDQVARSRSPVPGACLKLPQSTPRRRARSRRWRYSWSMSPRKSDINLRSPVGRIAREADGGDVWLRRRLDRLRQRRLPRLYFVNGAPGSANALYHNNRDGTFTDVTAKAGGRRRRGRHAYTIGVAVGDYDNDGYLDLYVTALGPEHPVSATTATAPSPTSPPRPASPAARRVEHQRRLLDYDRDGELDLYVANYLDYRLERQSLLRQDAKRATGMYCNPTISDGDGRPLYRNNGDGTFTDVSKAAGIANAAGKGLGVRSAMSTATAGPTSTSPTTRAATFSSATGATAPSPNRPTAPASGSTSTATAGRHGRRRRRRRRRTASRRFS